MKLSKILNLSLFMIILLMSSCGSDDPPAITKIPEVLITTSITGTVVDEAGLPLKDVTVNAGIATTTTDDNGIFLFDKLMLNKNGAKVSVLKDGYFNSTKMVFTKSNKTATTKIMLIEKKLSGSFDTAAGGVASTNGGATVEIPADGVKLESGGTYSGTVNVYATWIDPSASDLSQRMPGDLRATSSDNKDVKLETYGMIGVELEGTSGQSLNIAAGKTATIEIPVPSALLGSAPASIPLWHFDEATGFWIEEGTGTLTSNNTYIGTVSHFSFWNWDIPHELIKIDGLVIDQRQEPLRNLQVLITMVSNGAAAYGYTDQDGFYEGYVPKDEDLTITIFDACGVELYTGSIGPFSVDTTVPTITVDNATGNFITITGLLHDCNNQIEPDGYLRVHLTNSAELIPVENDGSFNSTVNICDLMEVGISGVSYFPFSQGTTTIHDISGINELNVGTIQTCY